MAKSIQSGQESGNEGRVCFVFDVGVVGRYYSLATCRTQTSKVRLIEKLEQLVGESDMVVISKDDIICQGCATMINSLDRLEKKLGSLKFRVLSFLEKKYDLGDRELVNTRSINKVAKSDILSSGFQSRKRRAMSDEVDADESKDSAEESAGEGNEMTLQAVEEEDRANRLYLVDENGILQKVEQTEDGVFYVQIADNSYPTKQVLSVGEDGSVGMVEVLWDDMVTGDESEGNSMVTFKDSGY